MLEHNKQALLDAVEQALTEIIGDYMDSSDLMLSQALAGVEDPVVRHESELHIRMARAALVEYRKTIIDNS